MTFSDELIACSEDIWQGFYTHPFITGMIDGTLDKKKFLRYLIQDTKYLVDYAKVYAHSFTKSDSVDIMRHIYRDMNLIMSNEGMMHIKYLKDLGYTEEQALAEEMLPANRKYLDSMIENAKNGTVAEGIVSVMPCAFSYYYIAHYAAKKAKEDNTLEGNYFRAWIDDYSGPLYQAIYDSAYSLCNKVAEGTSEEEKERLKEIFREGSRHELAFWDMAFEE